jgi:hypothetical protein
MMNPRIATLLLALPLSAVAAPESDPTDTTGPKSPPVITELPKFSDKPDGTGLGFGIGEPTGIAVAFRPNASHTIAGVVGWSLQYSTLHAHADYLVTVARIQPPESVLSADVYAGAGPTINIGDASQPGFGARIPLGVSLAFEKPVDVFMEVAPVLALFPETGLAINATVGIRTWFRSTKPQ